MASRPLNAACPLEVHHCLLTQTILYSISLNSVIEGKILTAKTKPFSHPAHNEKSMATITSYAYMQINNRPGVECDQVNPVGVSHWRQGVQEVAHRQFDLVTAINEPYKLE